MALRIILAIVLASIVLVAGLKLVTQLNSVYTANVKGVVNYGEKLLDNITGNKEIHINTTLEKSIEKTRLQYRKSLEKILENITRLYENITKIIRQLNITRTTTTDINSTTIRTLEEKLRILEEEIEKYRELLNAYSDGQSR